MRGLVPYAWRHLVARPARTLLTAFGIAIGVAVLVATLAVNAGLDKSVDRQVDSMIGRADLRVAAFTETGLSARTLAAIEAVPGVALTAPATERRTFLSAGAGHPATTQPITVLGIDVPRERRVRDLDVVRGDPAATLGASDALITERLAASDGLDVGSEIAVLGAGAPVHAVVAGILAGNGPLPGDGRTVVLGLPAAASLSLADGADPSTTAGVSGLSRIDIVLAAGADRSSVTAALVQALAFEPYVLWTPADVASSLRAATDDIRSTMALLAAISLFAAAFVILNTLAMTVTERVRELGLLRAAGATRRQIVEVVLAQAIMVGTLGAVLGLVAGVALAQVAAAWLRGSGGAPIDGPAVTAPVLAGGLVAGLVITLVAAMEPARRAASISPVAALRARSDGAAAVRSHASWLVVIVVLVGVFAAILLPPASASGTLPIRALAVYGLLLFAVLATPAVLGPLGRLAGLPFAGPLRLEERLARASIARDRGRTTATVGALVIGLAMVVALGAVATNARASATAWVSDVVPGDEVLTAIAPSPVGPDGIDEEISAIDGVVRATPVAAFDLAFDGRRLDAVAIRGADFGADGRLTFVAGDRDAALAAIDAGRAVILPRSRAEQMGVGFGDDIVVATAAGPTELTVAGIVERSFPGKSGEAALVGWSDATSRLGVLGADAYVIRFDPAMAGTASVAVADLATQLALTVAPVSQIDGAQGAALDGLFGLLDLLALAAVVVAGLGIVNTLSMGTWERIRELGVLRAAGMSRRQVWRSVLVEAGILGTIGGVAGSIAGLAVGALLVAFAGSLGAGLQVPWGSIALALVLGVALAMLAAAQPARIAGRRSIVSAVRTE
jgi:putative ABC transport system permease protein